MSWEELIAEVNAELPRGQDVGKVMGAAAALIAAQFLGIEIARRSYNRHWTRKPIGFRKAYSAVLLGQTAVASAAGAWTSRARQLTKTLDDLDGLVKAIARAGDKREAVRGAHWREKETNGA